MCSNGGCECGGMCSSKEFYKYLYRVDDRGRAVPLSPTTWARVTTFIVGNYVFSYVDDGGYYVDYTANTVMRF